MQSFYFYVPFNFSHNGMITKEPTTTATTTETILDTTTITTTIPTTTNGDINYCHHDMDCPEYDECCFLYGHCGSEFCIPTPGY